MAEEVNVKCTVCGEEFYAMDDEITRLKCPECEGKLQKADAAPLPEKEFFEETLREYTFDDGKTTPEEAKKIRDQLLPPGSAPKMPNSAK